MKGREIKRPKPVQKKATDLGKRPKVLFVDDDHLIHRYTYDVAREVGVKHRHVYSVAKARTAIAKRFRAIRKLQEIKRKQLLKSKSPKQKAILINQLEILQKMRKKPFDLIVSDVNMPAGFPVGVYFASGLKKKYPKQKVLMHSDDIESLDYLSNKYKIPYVSKMNFNAEENLRNEIKKMIQAEKK
ncbi:MAG TPA: response regulator [archaeon]|nr:response regulator [archaeon]